MDFMKWLNSLDELLYEVMSWLVFYPLTLWRSLLHPIAIMDYAERQLELPDADQYSDALSPPLFLALTLALAHVASSSLGEVDAIVAARRGVAGMINDETSALLFRLLIFAIFPVMMSLRLIHVRRARLNRQTLRIPFYAQCYPASLFALGFSSGAIMTGLPSHNARIAGFSLMLATAIYYLALETRWFAAQTGTGKLRAFGSALRAFVEGFVLLLAIASLVLR